MVNRPDVKKIMTIYEKLPAYERLIDNMQSELNESTQFNDLPIMKRKIMIEKQSNCIMPEYFVDYLNNNLKTVRTSGSTGQYLEVYWRDEDYVRSMAELWILRAKFYGIYPHNRLFFFFTGNEQGDEYIKRNNEIGVCKSLLKESELKRVYDIMMEWNPEWMLLQPSTAVIFCGYIKRHRLEPPKALKYVEFSGEILTDEIREMTRDVLGCVVANQYGCNEVNSIAYECPNGNMHILNNNVFVEIVDEYGNVTCDSSDCTENSDEEGKIIITSLQNKVMPFVRYEIGDRGRLKKNDNCKCGCKGKILELSSGRNNDYVYFSDGEYTSSYLFVNIFDIVNLNTDGAIIQYYVEQIGYDEFNIMLCIDDEFEEDEIIDIFYECIENRQIKNAKFNFEFSERLFEIRGMGKHMYFKNSISKIIC